ncbi:MAG TPA: DUF502 domain-containing protein [Gemmatimonadales bacterium]|nr:DUF502 domain-containing protein [Gemmatimonadales bacterium]
MSRPLRRLRRYFIVGLVVVAPVGATILVLSWAFRTIDAILGRPLERSVGVHVPGLGLAILALVIFLVGWGVQNAVGRRVVHRWNAALSRFPLTRRVYNVGSQIVQAMFAGDRRMFSRAVLVPYPAEGAWAVGFVTNEHTAAFSEIVGEPCLTVFVPTTFSVPPSGYLLIVPTARARPLGVSVEDAFKFVVSAGAVLPTGAPPPPGLDLARLLGREA